MVSTALLMLAPAASAQGKLWVVAKGGGPGVDFANIQPAVNAAADGDAILVGAGIYRSFQIDGKSLILVADEGADVQVRNTATVIADFVRIVNLAADQVVLIDGIGIEVLPTGAPFSFFVAPLALRDNAGAVFVEDVEVGGSQNEGGALDALNCASVTLVRCRVEGGTQQGHGLFATNSTVLAYDTSFQGGPSDEATSRTLACVDPGRAGDGALLVGSSLFASGCSFEGGEGRNAVDPIVPLLGSQGGAGGDGVRLSTSSFEWLDSSFSPGSGGLFSFSCPGGPDGTGVSPGPASSYETSEFSRGLEAGSPVREDQPTSLSFRGEPFDLVFLSVSPEALGGLPLPPFVGRLHLGSPSFLFSFGALSILGTKTVPISIGLSPGDDYAQLFLQAAHFDLAGDFVLGSPTSLVVLDGTF